MPLERKKTGNSVIIFLPATIDMVLSAAIEKELNIIFREDSESSFVMNLKNVNVISSSGLRIFITARRKLRESNREIVICSVEDEGVMETFKAAKLMDIFKIFKTEEQALEYLRGKVSSP